MEPLEPQRRIVHVVDDDASLLRAVARLLRSHGYDGQDLFLCFRVSERGHSRLGPACLLLDLNMPGMTGLELQQVISDYQSRLPIVFISGQGDIPSSVKAMKAGAVDFLTKPFEGDELLAAIDAALNRSHAANASNDSLQQDWDRFQKLSPERAAGLFALRPGHAEQADRRRTRYDRKNHQGAAWQRHAKARREFGSGGRAPRRPPARRGTVTEHRIAVVIAISSNRN